MRIILIFLLIAAFGCGCNTLPEQYSAAPGRSLVEGVMTEKKPNPMIAFHGILSASPTISSYEPASTTWVEITAVDGNSLPETTVFHYANKVWLEPGVHQVIAFCSTAYSDQTLMSGTNIEINVQSDYNYYITSKPLEITSAHPLRLTAPQIEVTKKKIK